MKVLKWAIKDTIDWRWNTEKVYIIQTATIRKLIWLYYYKKKIDFKATTKNVIKDKEV